MSDGTGVDERAARRVGQTVGKYRLEAVLGQGGMATVYRATHRNGNKVAVKMLLTELSVEPELRARFLREGYLANKVDHPGVVRVLDDDVAKDGSVFLVMELLVGETLDALQARQGTLQARRCLEVADDVLDVLAAAHDRGIVHRDLKPENLFLPRDGGVKVLDFGIARLLEATHGPTATRSGRALGTPAFMAPEQALGRKDLIDARTDLWGLGATLFTVVTGRFVHEAQTPETMVVLTATRQAPSLAAVSPGQPSALIEIVDRALQIDKSNRWSDARTMQAAVRRALSGLDEQEALLGPDDEPPSAHTRKMAIGWRPPARTPPGADAPTDPAPPSRTPVDRLNTTTAGASSDRDLPTVLRPAAGAGAKGRLRGVGIALGAALLALGGAILLGRKSPPPPSLDDKADSFATSGATTTPVPATRPSASPPVTQPPEVPLPAPLPAPSPAAGASTPRTPAVVVDAGLAARARPTARPLPARAPTLPVKPQPTSDDLYAP
jgi:serine/threonine protein kinase